MSWTAIARVDEIPRLGARVLEAEGLRIAVFRTSDDRVFALEDRCPHRGGPLSQGIVHGHCVTCPLHDWVIDLSTGRATGADDGETGAFAVRIVDGRVFVDLGSGIDDERISEAVRPSARDADAGSSSDGDGGAAPAERAAAPAGGAPARAAAIAAGGE